MQKIYHLCFDPSTTAIASPSLPHPPFLCAAGPICLCLVLPPTTVYPFPSLLYPPRKMADWSELYHLLSVTSKVVGEWKMLHLQAYSCQCRETTIPSGCQLIQECHLSILYGIRIPAGFSFHFKTTIEQTTE